VTSAARPASDVGARTRPGAIPSGLRVERDEVTLDVADTGPRSAPAVLLVSGLGAQRTDWPVELLAGLRAARLRVVCVDNRDAGWSTWLDHRPGTLEDLHAYQRGEPFAVPYRLEDLAADLVGVLDHVGLGVAHVVGQSMGGMVAQRVAIGWPGRVASLTSVMSTTGASDVGQPTPEVLEVMAGPSPTERTDWIEANVARSRLTNSPTLFDPVRARARFAAAWDRGGINPAGKLRQLLAIAADGDRTPALRGLDVPTLVVHGRRDPVVDVSGGHATAAAVPGARLLELDEMAHDLPLPLLPTITGAVVAHVLDAASRPSA
jgi:pimeloyl-ACP methyl ester carboxylesterase